MSRAVPILMYHQVSPRAPAGFGKYVVRPSQLARQIAWLARAGYEAVDLDALLAHRRAEGGLPRRAVVITFDDGFRDLLDHAVPLLADRGYTAVFYLVAGLMGQGSRWLAAERGVDLPLMDWDAARALERAGFRCGSHTLTHPRLAEIPLAARREELVRSKELLERELGRAERHLAYPHGSHDAATRALAAELGYATACTVRPGLARPGDDPLALPRVPVSGVESLADFAWRVRTASAPDRWVRRLLAAVCPHAPARTAA